MRLTPFCSLSTSALLFAPPITIPNVCEWCDMSSFATPKIWRASSRVGDTMTIPVPIYTSTISKVAHIERCKSVPLRGLNFILCSNSMAGIKKARVFPEPVLAAPSTSLPASSGGIALSWIGVMCVKPISARALVVGSESSSSENGLRPDAFSSGTGTGAETPAEAMMRAFCRVAVFTKMIDR